MRRVPFACDCDARLEVTQAADIVLSYVVDVVAEEGLSDTITMSGTFGGQPFSDSQRFPVATQDDPNRLVFSFSFDRALFGSDEYAEYEAALTSTLIDLDYQMVQSGTIVSQKVYFGTPGVRYSEVPKLSVDADGAMFSLGTQGDFFSNAAGGSFKSAGGFESAAGTFSTLTATGSGYELVDRNNTVYVFDADGYL